MAVSRLAASPGAELSYRYLRLSLIAMVLLLGVAVMTQITRGVSLHSISASYYTPARTIFVGTLFAVGIALVAIRGSLDLENLLLNVAGVVAPLIAAVPTPLRAGSITPGSANIVRCEPDQVVCVPAALHQDVEATMFALIVVGILVFVTAVVAAIVDRAVTAWAVIHLSITGALLAGAVAWFLFARASFMVWAHYAVTGVFFFCILAIVIFNAFFVRYRDTRLRHLARQRFVVAYSVIAIVMTIVLVTGTGATMLQVAGQLSDVGELVLASESVSIVLFALFWLFQTIQKWTVSPTPRDRNAKVIANRFTTTGR